MKRRYIAVIASFLGVLLFFSVTFFISPDKDVSASERRKLIQFSTYSEQKALKGEDYDLSDYFSFLESYALDQFPIRDSFRSLKAMFKKYVLFQKDNNGYYLADGTLSRIDETLNEKAVSDSVSHFNTLYEMYFKDTDAAVYYSIIPDKNYFIAEKNGYMHYDYDEMYEMTAALLDKNITGISIRNMLSIKDYYVTDPHWDQANILPIADKLLSAMECEGLASDHNWNTSELSPFYGTYYGQAALPISADTLTYLTGEALEGVTVFDHSSQKTVGIYDENDFSNVDPYDVFLGGALPLLTISNPNQQNGKQLVLFRDSFGSSIAPLLVSEYSEVVVVDIRYISPKFIGNMVEFQNDCDVLFLYSTSVLNTYGIFAG